MAKRYQYKIISSSNGFPELEKKVSKMMDDGWKPVGGLTFNMNAPYQAMARQVEISTVRPAKPVTSITTPQTNQPKTFNQTLKDIDDYT